MQSEMKLTETGTQNRIIYHIINDKKKRERNITNY